MKLAVGGQGQVKLRAWNELSLWLPKVTEPSELPRVKAAAPVPQHQGGDSPLLGVWL